MIWKEFEDYKRPEKLVESVWKSVNHLDLVTLFESDSAEDFDVVILKALFKG